MRIVSTTRAIKAALLGTLMLSAAMLGAQTNPTPPAAADTTTLSVRSNLVLVPALVKTKSGEVVFELTANDFVLTDNGVPQRLRMEDDNDAQPIAIVVVMQTGGQGAAHLNDYAGLASVLDAVIGNVPYRIAVVGFDSRPHLDLDFTADKAAAADAVSRLSAGDGGAAILDSLSLGIDLLRKQPPAYRRVLLLFSETIDHGSQSTFPQALRAVDDTNTSIYSFGFSSEKIALKREASKAPRPGGSEYSSTGYGPGGCMGKGSDPDANGNRAVQALDCASDLLPPLRLPRLAYIAASDGFKRNIPESVAQLTGGEYFTLKTSKLLSQDLVHIANDLPNHYVLSFSPQSPGPGFHALELKLKDRPDLEVRARNAYWIDAESTAVKK
jgi:VWFA-related protein